MHGSQEQKVSQKSQDNTQWLILKAQELWPQHQQQDCQTVILSQCVMVCSHCAERHPRHPDRADLGVLKTFRLCIAIGELREIFATFHTLGELKIYCTKYGSDIYSI